MPSSAQYENSLLVSYCIEDGISLPKYVYFQKICRFPEVFNTHVDIDFYLNPLNVSKQ